MGSCSGFDSWSAIYALCERTRLDVENGSDAPSPGGKIFVHGYEVAKDRDVCRVDFICAQVVRCGIGSGFEEERTIWPDVLLRGL